MKYLPAALLFLFATSFASAGLIVSTGTPDFTQPNSRGIDTFRVADDFVLAGPASIDSIRLWLVTQPGEFQGTLTYAFYQNSAGALGSLIQSGSVSGITLQNTTQIPGNIHSISQVDFSLPSALALGAGTFWLEIHHGSSLTTSTGFSNVLWALTSTGGVGGNAKQNPNPGLPSNSVNNELAFQLFGNDTVSPVPEPATVSISLVGLAAIGLLRVRRG